MRSTRLHLSATVVIVCAWLSGCPGNCPSGSSVPDSLQCGEAQTCSETCCSEKQVCYLGKCTDPGSMAGRVAVGAEHSCAIGPSGDLYCWGDNSSYQLGTDAWSISVHPLEVSVDSAVFVDPNRWRTCAIDDLDRLFCWGDNISSAVGLDPSLVRYESRVEVPTHVHKGISFAMVAGGQDHTCALDVSGSTWCWGYYPGAGDFSGKWHEPRLIEGAPQFQRIAAGFSHTCGLTADGAVFCWGQNVYGQVNPLSGGDIEADPVQVPELVGPVAFLATGRHATCAILATGELACWGQMSHPSFAGVDCWPSNEPPKLDGVAILPMPADSVSAVAVGQMSLCVVSSAGDVYCSGCSGSYQRGVPSEDLHPGWGKMPTVEGVVTISGESSNFCALTSKGETYCWGNFWDGQLGDGSSLNLALPIQVPGVTDSEQLVASSASTCLVSKDDVLDCWGKEPGVLSDDGTYGGGPGSGEHLPGLRSLTIGFSSSPAAQHGCFVTADGGVTCWGNNSSGQLGVEGVTFSGSQLDVEVAKPLAQSVSAGGRYTCSLADSGDSITCWGSFGKCIQSDSETIQSMNLSATIEFGWSSIAAVVTGTRHACALSTLGEVACWGDNELRQLGSAGSTACSQPVVVPLDGAVKLAAQGDHSCAMNEEGEVWCWGDNSLGVLSSADESSLEPVKLNVSTPVSEFCVGLNHICALREDGEVLCRGKGSYGQLGAGLFPWESAFVVVSFGKAPEFGVVASLTCGENHTCAQDVAGRVACWGANWYKQLGVGSNTWAGMPAKVKFPPNPN